MLHTNKDLYYQGSLLQHLVLWSTTKVFLFNITPFHHSKDILQLVKEHYVPDCIVRSMPPRKQHVSFNFKNIKIHVQEHSKLYNLKENLIKFLANTILNKFGHIQHGYRTQNDLHVQNTSLSKCPKGVYYTGIKLLSNPSHCHKKTEQRLFTHSYTIWCLNNNNIIIPQSL
jgi:hypothetical protein